MIRELFRPLLTWLFWNRRRPLLALALLLVAVGILGRLAGCGATASPAAAGAAPHPTAFTPAAGPAPSGVFSPAARPSSAGAAPASPTAAPQPAAATAALADARAFLHAWAGHGPGRTARIRATATPRLAGEVTGPGANLAPVTTITGPVTVTSRTPSTVNLTAPTDAGPVLLTVRLTTGRWQAAQVTLDQAGN